MYSIKTHIMKCPSLWPSGIGTHLGRNKQVVRVRILAVLDTYVHRAYDYPGPYGVCLGIYNI